MEQQTSPAKPMISARDKVVSLEELGQKAREAQAAGHAVVLAHGVFDLVHMGHVRHLEQARREGDVLLVTVTADKYVNKGPGRPIFSENLRAEMLAALAYVDGVAVNPAPTAEGVLDAVRPDIYIKGSDYENPDDDITGKINDEREQVERHGGRMVFTKDITFSSSSLINRYLDVYDPPLRECLDSMRAENAMERIGDLLDSIAGYRVLLVGDAILDEYQYVTPMGKSPKENMIATLFQNKEVFAGGVFAAANHVANFCQQVDIITAVGDDGYEPLIRSSLKSNVGLKAITRAGKPTTRKCRFLEPGYMRKLFEVYFMDDNPLDAHERAELDGMLSEVVADYDVVIVTDFGHGLMGDSTIDTLCTKARFLAVNAQSNSANMGYNLITKYPRADYVCIDAPEARLATGEKFIDLADIAERVLPDRVDVDRLILTHGSHGCVTFDKSVGVQRIPAFTKTVVDTVGAGDAFLAVTSPLVAAGGRMSDVGFVGNAVGAMKVGIVGHRQSVEKVPLVKFITALLK